MPFLLPNQQRQSTEGQDKHTDTDRENGNPTESGSGN